MLFPVAMVDMAKTPEKIAEEAVPYDKRPIKPEDINEYPYGLCLSLDNDSLKKLGLDGADCEAGDGLSFMAYAKVTNCSSTDTAAGPQHRIELQITQIALSPDHYDEEEAA